MAVHIKCPIAQIRMKTPVRGKMCKHFQTFDLSNYIQSNFHCKNWLCPICGKSAITLRRCPLTEMIIKRADEILPLNKFKNLDEEGLVKLLMAELKKAQDDEPDQDEENDIKSVWIERESLTILIGGLRHLIDVDKITIVEDDPENASHEYYLPYLKEKNQKAVDEFIPQLQTH